MTCDKVQELLTSYLDNELTEDENVQISIHLEQCPECSVLLQYIREMQNTFDDIPEVDPPARIRKNVMKAIAEEKTTVQKKIGWQWKRAVAAFILFAVSIATGLQPLIAMKMEADTAAPYSLAVEGSQNIENIKRNQADDGVKSVPPASNGITYFTAQNSEPEPDVKEVKPIADEADSVSENDIKDATRSVAATEESGEKVEQPQLYATSKGEAVDFGKNLVGGVSNKVITLTEDVEVTEPKWYERLPSGRLVVAFSGVLFSLLMLWYSRPKKA